MSFFGESIIGPNSPVGMGSVNETNLCGRVLLSKNAFSDEIQFDVKGKEEGFATSTLDVITPAHSKHVFFGNTLKIEGEDTYLTLGVNGDDTLSNLARSTHQDTIFVSEGRVVEAVDKDGNRPEDSKWYALDPKELLKKHSGLIKVGETEYFFLHIAPYEGVDLHFFIFNPAADEFSLINSINEQSAELLKRISLQMRLASLGGFLFVLLVLGNIARRITRPISHLADLTAEVAEGRLEDIELPEKEKKRHDEIYTLYHSFFEMVKGLREKERVRGVLNKVVSKEIAEETLKGNIELGGEERIVTVLFADIRGFTALTEKMSPTEVIGLINTCMTKVSAVVDEFGGVIDKFVGDEVMALFGAPIEKEASALRAVQCAQGMVQALREWNQEREREGLIPVEMGVGIHTGVMVAGNMGAENRLNYTVMGSNVNLSSRLCSVAGRMQILISKGTLEAEGVQESVKITSLEPIQLKGFTDAVPVYEVES